MIWNRAMKTGQWAALVILHWWREDGWTWVTTVGKEGNIDEIYEGGIDKTQFLIEEVEMGRDGSKLGDRLKTGCGVRQE